MIEQSKLYDLPEVERQEVLSARDHNLRIAGDENKFQPLERFKKMAFPNQPELRRLFEFETQEGRIWYITRIMPGEEQFVAKSTNQGTHVMVWNKNVLVRIPVENEGKT